MIRRHLRRSLQCYMRRTTAMFSSLYSVDEEQDQSDRVKRMATDLETLRTEMQGHLQEVGIAVFHGYRRTADSPAQVYWDVERHADFREFVEAGRKAGARLHLSPTRRSRSMRSMKRWIGWRTARSRWRRSMPLRSVCASCRPMWDSRARWNFRLTWRAVFTYLNSGLRGIRR